MPAPIDFILNDREVRTSSSPGTPTLDYLRGEAGLMGTKEGCREGDCGACTVLTGEPDGAGVRYQPVTSCLLPLGELQGKHLVTIEGLNLPQLTPVQQAIVDQGATQCGFCTPGIVVSLTGYLMQAGPPVNLDGVKLALSGHLCRCTGYSSLKHCTAALQDAVDGPTSLDALLARHMLPDYFGGIPERLRKLPAAERPDGPPVPDYFMAGGTDLYVQEDYRVTDAQIDVLNLRPNLRGIVRENNHVKVGALTTFEEFSRDPEILGLWPDVEAASRLIASWQIRNRATLGGNIMNASPIGDLTIMLLALDARLVLQRGDTRRTVSLRSFYRGYKDMDRAPDELLVEIVLPVPPEGNRFHFEKVSKRKYLDIASVNCALSVTTADGLMTDVGLAVGGVAPVPLFMLQTGQFLTGKPVSVETVQGGIRAAQEEAAPISDIRGSADYKRLLVRQLMIAQFATLFPQEISVRAFYA